MLKQWWEIEHYQRETPKAKGLVKITSADSEGLGLIYTWPPQETQASGGALYIMFENHVRSWPLQKTP